MHPAPSGLQELAGRNRRPESRRHRLPSAPRCHSPPSGRSRSQHCSRNTPAPTGVPAPKLLLQVRELRQHMLRRRPLQLLHQSADQHLWRARHDQMNLILRHMPLHGPDLMLPADLSHQVPNPNRHLSLERPTPVLRDPHHVEMNLEHRMRAAPILPTHPSRLPAAPRALKPSPQGEGFDPHRMGQ